MAYTQGVAGDSIMTLGQIPAVSAVSTVVSGVESIFGGDQAEKQRIADLDAAFARGDANYLITWINDIPAHPAASVAYAKQKLAQLQGAGKATPTTGVLPGTPIPQMAAMGGLGALTSNPIILLALVGGLFFLSRR